MIEDLRVHRSSVHAGVNVQYMYAKRHSLAGSQPMGYYYMHRYCPPVSAYMYIMYLIVLGAGSVVKKRILGHKGQIRKSRF